MDNLIEPVIQGFAVPIWSINIYLYIYIYIFYRYMYLNNFIYVTRMYMHNMVAYLLLFHIVSKFSISFRFERFFNVFHLTLAPQNAANRKHKRKLTDGQWKVNRGDIKRKWRGINGKKNEHEGKPERKCNDNKWKWRENKWQLQGRWGKKRRHEAEKTRKSEEHEKKMKRQWKNMKWRWRITKWNGAEGKRNDN